MTSVLKVVGLVLIVGGLLLWVASVLPPMPFGFQEEPNTQLVASPLAAAIPPTDDGYVTLSGIVLYDDDVPYIAYELPDGGMRTKQLIFRDGNGCAPEAGDLPCAPGQQASFPTFQSGAPITVTGTIVSDQILVEHIAS